MQLQEIRNQMWVVVNGRPLRKAQENEVKRWATLRIIELLNRDTDKRQYPPTRTKTQPTAF